MTNVRPCPVCQTSSDKAALFLKNSINPERLSEFSFASRKTPEYMSYRLVQCPVCDLVYADQPPSEEELAHAYHTADFDSAEEANDAAAAYIQAISPTISTLVRRGSVLEIGTGTGIFLEHLSQQGFTELVGIEPSAAAIAVAPPNRRSWIRHGMFDEKDYAPESFDLICCFMTLEHVRNPKDIAYAALKLLRPGGAFVTVTHDYRGLVNRLLGKHSPIIDIEHLQLFSKDSLKNLFESAGFSDISVQGFVNTYSLQYWARLLPFPEKIKHAFLTASGMVGVGNVKLSFNVGNVITTGIKHA